VAAGIAALNETKSSTMKLPNAEEKEETMAVKPIPEGYHSVTPYLVVQGAAKLIEFLQKAFGAQVKERMDRPDGTVGHAEVLIGDSLVMLGEAGGQWKALNGALYLYVPDTDSTYKQALAAGASSLMAPANQFYGDRNAGVQDAWGNQWWIATHVEDVPPEEMKRRAEAATKNQAKA
jgi:PhnB protein